MAPTNEPLHPRIAAAVIVANLDGHPAQTRNTFGGIDFMITPHAKLRFAVDGEAVEMHLLNAVDVWEWSVTFTALTPYVISNVAALLAVEHILAAK